MISVRIFDGITWRVPTISGIQRAAVAITLVFSLILLAAGSSAACLGCAVGGTVMIANLFLLTIIGRGIVAVANQTGGTTRLGIIAAPLKLLFIVTVVALLLSRASINVPGFLLGVLTQPGAIFIETWRVSARAA